VDLRPCRERRRQGLEKLAHERVFHRAGEVERVEREFVFDVPDDGVRHDGVVVPERERPRPAQAVHEPPPVGVGDVQPLRLSDGDRQSPGVRPRVRLVLGLPVEVELRGVPVHGRSPGGGAEWFPINLRLRGGFPNQNRSSVRQKGPRRRVRNSAARRRNARVVRYGLSVFKKAVASAASSFSFVPIAIDKSFTRSDRRTFVAAVQMLA
jgi:hypothetical protein